MAMPTVPAPEALPPPESPQVAESAYVGKWASLCDRSNAG